MKTKSKLYLGFFLILLIGTVMGGAGLVSANSLSKLAAEQYKAHTESSQLVSILEAHYTWRETIIESVLYSQSFTGTTDPAACTLGKWLAGGEGQNVNDKEVLSLLAQVEKPHDTMHTSAARIKTALDGGDYATARQELADIVLPQANLTISLLAQIKQVYEGRIAAFGDESVRLGNTVRAVLAGVIIAAVLASVLLSLIISKSIMRPIEAVCAALERVVTGDLDVHVEYKAKDEIGRMIELFEVQTRDSKMQVAAAELLSGGDLTVEVGLRGESDAMGKAMQKMISSLNQMFGEINITTAQVNAGAGQIADAAQSLAQGSSEQAAAVEQLSGSIGDINVKTKQNADMAVKAAKLAQSIKADAEKGSVQMNQMMEAVRAIGQASQSISKVIKAIDDIAFQTNILSLNAAVEAARAGQHGKGFAVVAEEVRNLASKSAEAARDTGSLIANSIEKAELGAQIAEETAASLTGIVSGINESSRLVSEIARGSEDQSAAICQINRGIDQVAQVVQQNSAAAEETSAAGLQMSEQATQLKELVSRFKVKGGELSAPLPLVRSYHRPAANAPIQFSLPEDGEKY